MTPGPIADVVAWIRSNGRLLGTTLLVSALLVGATLGAVGGLPGAAGPDAADSNAPAAWMMGGSFDAAEAETGDRDVLSVLGHESIDALLLVATYSKYNDVSPLEHEVRSELMAIVTALPGLYVAQIVGRTGHSPSTIRYHLKILEREGLVMTASLFGNRRLFPASVDRAEIGYLAAKREPATARIVEAIEEADGSTSPSSLADTVDRAPSTISHHLARLEDAAVIQREREGNHVRVSLRAPGDRRAMVDVS